MLTTSTNEAKACSNVFVNKLRLILNFITKTTVTITLAIYRCQFSTWWSPI